MPHVLSTSTYECCCASTHRCYVAGVKQAHERGELGAWLVAQRKRLSEERGFRVTQQIVVDELAEQGYPIDPSYYRAIESGAKKTAGMELREALARYFGRTPPVPSASGGGSPADMGRLIAAVEAQTAAINRLVDRLETPAAPDPEALAEALGEALALHLAPLLAGGQRDPQPEAAQ